MFILNKHYDIKSIEFLKEVMKARLLRKGHTGGHNVHHSLETLFVSDVQHRTMQLS